MSGLQLNSREILEGLNDVFQGIYDHIREKPFPPTRLHEDDMQHLASLIDGNSRAFYAQIHDELKVTSAGQKEKFEEFDKSLDKLLSLGDVGPFNKFKESNFFPLPKEVKLHPESIDELGCTIVDKLRKNNRKQWEETTPPSIVQSPPRQENPLLDKEFIHGSRGTCQLCLDVQVKRDQKSLMRDKCMKHQNWRLFLTCFPTEAAEISDSLASRDNLQVTLTLLETLDQIPFPDLENAKPFIPTRGKPFPPCTVKLHPESIDAVTTAIVEKELAQIRQEWRGTVPQYFLEKNQNREFQNISAELRLQCMNHDNWGIFIRCFPIAGTVIIDGLATLDKMRTTLALLPDLKGRPFEELSCLKPMLYFQDE